MSHFKRHPAPVFRVLPALLFALFLAASALAEERIISYESDLLINQDGSLEVTETITVQAEGNAIRQGIYRDFPTRYRDRYNNRVRADFELLEVLRNGASEPHRVEQLGNGLRIYAGSSGQYLTPGVHEYVFRFRTQRQLGFFEDFDELYWNVTGNGWAFPIDQATARVRLPGAVAMDDLRIAWYTGAQGAQGKAAAVTHESSQQITISSTAPLGVREGLTIAVGWPKGLVTEPAATQRAGWFLRDNAGALVLLIALLGILGWYLWAWNRYGRDPAKGVIIPRYEAPSGLSAAACRYVLDMAFRQASFTAAIISLGVKGYVQIEEDDDQFTLRARRSEGTAPLSPGEQGIYDALLPDGVDSISLKQSEYSRFGKAKSALSTALSKEYKGRLFKVNGWFAVPAFILSIVAILFAAILGQDNPLIWFGWMALILGIHMLFLFLLKAPSLAGRKVMDEIEGFRLYLGTAEQQRLDAMKSPRLTPEVFESFLPYAYALGVENDWCERFMRELPDVDGKPGHYQPHWYSGDLGRASTLNHLGSNLNSSLSKAIVSAASPPGSSSGSGGGGSSGGGGGGGGGGGW